MDVTQKQKWIKNAFHCYYKNKQRLPQLKADYERIAIPMSGGQDPNKPYVKSSVGNGVEKSVLEYLFSRERYENMIKDCEDKIAVVEKTMQHFSVEETAKGKKHRKYIECRFVKGMSYTASAIECDLRERTSDFVIEEIMTVAYAIAEIEGFFNKKLFTAKILR